MSAPYFRQVCAEVAQRHGISDRDMRLRKRERSASWARQEVFYLLWLEKKPNGEWRFSTPQIGAHFGLDHTTVLHGIRQHMERAGLTYVGRCGGKANKLRGVSIRKAEKAIAVEQAAARWNAVCEARGWPLEAA